MIPSIIILFILLRNNSTTWYFLFHQIDTYGYEFVSIMPHEPAIGKRINKWRQAESSMKESQKKIEREETTVKESQKKEEYRGRQDSNLRGQIQHDF